MPCMPDIISKGLILAKVDEALNNPAHRAILEARLYDWEAKFDTPAKLKLENLGQGIPVGLKYNLLTPTERAHMRYDWFKKWWPDAQKRGPNGKNGVEWVLGNALIQLIKIANDQCCDKIIDCYWVCAAQHDHSCAHPKGQGVITLPAEAYPDPQIQYDLTRGYVPVQLPAPRRRPGKGKGQVICSTDERVDCSITWSRAQITFTVHTPPPGAGYLFNPRTMTVPEPIMVVKWDDTNQVIDTNVPARAAYPD